MHYFQLDTRDFFLPSVCCSISSFPQSHAYMHHRAPVPVLFYISFALLFLVCLRKFREKKLGRKFRIEEMGRAPCCDKANVKKGPWSPEEDSKLKEFIDKYGTGGNWIALPHKAGLKRCGKSCRLRWLNYLRPNIKHGEFSEEEDRIICNLFATIGSRWSIIASQLPGRTDNDIKNYWNTKLKKKLLGTSTSSQRKPHKSQQLFSSPVPQLPSTQLQDCYINDAKPLALVCEGFPAISPNAIPNYDPMQDLRYQFQMKETSNMITFSTDQSCSTSDGSYTKISYGKYVGSDCGGEQKAMEKSIYGDLEGSKLLLIGGNECELEYNYEENIKQLMNLSNFGCNNDCMSNISNFHLDYHPKATGEREDPQPQYRTDF